MHRDPLFRDAGIADRSPGATTSRPGGDHHDHRIGAACPEGSRRGSDRRPGGDDVVHENHRRRAVGEGRERRADPSFRGTAAGLCGTACSPQERATAEPATASYRPREELCLVEAAGPAAPRAGGSPCHRGGRRHIDKAHHRLSQPSNEVAAAAVLQRGDQAPGGLVVEQRVTRVDPKRTRQRGRRAKHGGTGGADRRTRTITDGAGRAQEHRRNLRARYDNDRREDAQTAQ